MASLRPVDRWGPFADGIDRAERLARLRALRVVAHMVCGLSGLALQMSIRRAEADPTDDALITVVADIEALASIPRRHLLASYAAVARDDRSALGAA